MLFTAQRQPAEGLVGPEIQLLTQKAMHPGTRGIYSEGTYFSTSYKDTIWARSGYIQGYLVNKQIY